MTRGIPRSAKRGFTLVEVLVALTVVAIALMAGFEAAGALTRNAQRQTDVLLAHLCAENILVKARLSGQLPGVGDSSEDCQQGGRAFTVKLNVKPTPNPTFRRLDAQVFEGDAMLLRLSTILGRL